MKKREYRLIPHTADICFEVNAKNLKELFLKAANALKNLMVHEKKIGKKVRDKIIVNAIDQDALLVNWLQENLYNFYVRGLIFRDAKIKKLTEKEMISDVEFVKFDPMIHIAGKEIKAVTYHNVKIRRDGNKFSVRILLDV